MLKIKAILEKVVLLLAFINSFSCLLSRINLKITFMWWENINFNSICFEQNMYTNVHTYTYVSWSALRNNKFNTVFSFLHNYIMYSKIVYICAVCNLSTTWFIFCVQKAVRKERTEKYTRQQASKIGHLKEYNSPGTREGQSVSTAENLYCKGNSFGGFLLFSEQK